MHDEDVRRRHLEEISKLTKAVKLARIFTLISCATSIYLLRSDIYQIFPSANICHAKTAGKECDDANKRAWITSSESRRVRQIPFTVSELRSLDQAPLIKQCGYSYYQIFSNEVPNCNLYKTVPVLLISFLLISCSLILSFLSSVPTSATNSLRWVSWLRPHHYFVYIFLGPKLSYYIAS